LVVITIIGMLAAMSLGALTGVREMGREAATKATIAKLNAIIMRRYESYMYRRVPVDLSGLTPTDAATARLYAIRDLMRMEMPDRIDDITDGPITITLPSGKTASIPQRPALMTLYNSYYTAHYHDPGPAMANKLAGPAAMLYMIVSLGSPEDMEQFTQAEIGDTDNDGLLEFLDGWGRPISFLRWAPGFSQYSDIQVADKVNHHDPFDPRRMDTEAYQLFPLIYSAGPNGEPGLDIGTGGTPFSFASVQGKLDWSSGSSFAKMGSASDNQGKGTFTDFQDNITNHHIEAR
jgi:hypothetical protein